MTMLLTNNFPLSRHRLLTMGISAFLACVLFALFSFRATTSYRMPADYNYDADFGRDLLRITEITKGKITLIGPQLSFNGLHTAPYGFYGWAPLLYLSSYQYQSLVYAQAFLFTVSFIVLWIWISKRTNIVFSSLATLWLATSPYILLSARSPGNAFTYVFVLILLLYQLLTQSSIQKGQSAAVGFIAGILANFHPITLLISPFVFLIKSISPTVHSKRTDVVKIALFTVLLLTTFLPVILFDVRHGFVISRNLINPQGYAQFLASGNSTSALSLHSRVFAMHTQFTSSLYLGPLGLLIGTGILVWFAKDRKQWSLLYCIALLNFILLSITQKGALHYYIPTFVFIQILFITLLSGYRRRTLLITFLLAGNLVIFPKVLYQPARNLGDVEQNFEQYLKISPSLPKTGLNVVLLNETTLSKVGFEYRFLLLKNNYAIDTEFSYATSPYLLLVSEKGPVNWENESSWELSSFGEKILLNTTSLGQTTYYLFAKN